MKTIRITVSGKVQGVFFRRSVVETAHALKIIGTVKNCDDGSVEIVGTAEDIILQQLVAWCHKGPPKAHVADVTVQQLPLQSFDNFSIIR